MQYSVFIIPNRNSFEDVYNEQKKQLESIKNGLPKNLSETERAKYNEQLKQAEANFEKCYTQFRSIFKAYDRLEATIKNLSKTVETEVGDIANAKGGVEIPLMGLKMRIQDLRKEVSSEENRESVDKMKETFQEQLDAGVQTLRSIISDLSSIPQEAK